MQNAQQAQLVERKETENLLSLGKLQDFHNTKHNTKFTQTYTTFALIAGNNCDVQKYSDTHIMHKKVERGNRSKNSKKKDSTDAALTWADVVGREA